MHWYQDVLRNKYAKFSGRARRREFWMYFLCSVLIATVLTIIDGITGTLNLSTGVGLLSGLYSFAVVVPGLAVTVRRLHDTDRSGWWFLIVLLPLIGFIVLLVFVCLDSAPAENRHGPSPKAATA